MRTLTAISRWWVALKKAIYGTYGALWDAFNPGGYVEARLIYADGPLKGQVAKTFKGKNVITGLDPNAGSRPFSGRDMMRRLIIPSGFGDSVSGDTDSVFGQIELGSGTTAESSDDPNLVAPIALTLKAVESVDVSTINQWVTFIVNYDEGEANTAISEVGFWSTHATDPNFLARKTFGSFTKTNAFTLQLRWTIKL